MGTSRVFTPQAGPQAGCRHGWLQGAAVAPPGHRARLGGLTSVPLHTTQRSGKPENPDFHFQRWSWERKKIILQGFRDVPEVLYDGMEMWK